MDVYDGRWNQHSPSYIPTKLHQIRFTPSRVNFTIRTTIATDAEDAQGSIRCRGQQTAYTSAYYLPGDAWNTLSLFLLPRCFTFSQLEAGTRPFVHHRPSLLESNGRIVICATLYSMNALSMPRPPNAWLMEW